MSPYLPTHTPASAGLMEESIDLVALGIKNQLHVSDTTTIHLPTHTPASAGSEEGSIDLVAMGQKNELNNKPTVVLKSQPELNSYIPLDTPKNPQGHLLRYYTLIASDENQGCEYDLETGFSDIWTAYKDRSYSSKTSRL
ncbi:hypothetical protein CIB48_g9886 [Xylaria polymorpha]|nr:hypothetical protein CIB48_g9886 [Xylaria polymorpha]